MLKATWIGIALVVVLIGPNAFWLARSTVRIENRAAARVSAVTLQACSEEFPIGALAPGSSVFRVLPKCGDDTLIVSSGANRICRLYVEGSLYHVRVWFSSSSGGDCMYGSPPFHPLVLAQLL